MPADSFWHALLIYLLLAWGGNASANVDKKIAMRSPKILSALEPHVRMSPPAADTEIFPNKLLASVWLTQLLSNEECEWLIDLAEKADDWKPRLNYDTREVQLSQLPEFANWIDEEGGLQDRIFELLRAQFQLAPAARLVRHNSNIIRYDSSSNATNHVIYHSDVSHFTVNTLLSNQVSFSGGGTGMIHLNTTLFPKQGQMLSYYGNAFHSGEPVTSGYRYIWQGFIHLIDENGNELKMDGEDEAQIILGQQALRVHPELGDAWYSVGNLLRDQGRLQESETFLSNAGHLQYGSKNKDLIYAKLAQTYVQEQRLDEAKVLLQDAVAINPSSDVLMQQLDALEMLTKIEAIKRADMDPEERARMQEEIDNWLREGEQEL